MKSYFILGTDTDCGKTYATVALLTYLRQQNLQARALKPVASGCQEINGIMQNDDVARLQSANQDTTIPICQWMMHPPIAPHLAAKEAGFSITSAKIKAFYESYPKQDLDYLLIEGAGGLFVPLNDQETWVDFLYHSRMPVILIVGMRLGCINHALLTAYALRKHHIACEGWIANFLDPQMVMADRNLETLQQWIHFPFLGEIPFEGSFQPQQGFA